MLAVTLILFLFMIISPFISSFKVKSLQLSPILSISRRFLRTKQSSNRFTFKSVHSDPQSTANLKHTVDSSQHVELADKFSDIRFIEENKGIIEFMQCLITQMT